MSQQQLVKGCLTAPIAVSRRFKVLQNELRGKPTRSLKPSHLCIRDNPQVGNSRFYFPQPCPINSINSCQLAHNPAYEQSYWESGCARIVVAVFLI